MDFKVSRIHNKIDVLNLEWTSGPSRDRVMATLVCNYLRRQGFSVGEYSVHDGLDEINELCPRLLFMTNTIGARENFEIMRYAVQRGVLGVSLIVEGNIREGDADLESAMIWGWNHDRVLYEDLHFQWSERTRRITLRQHPELKGKVLISGGVGFDNYKIGITVDRSEILRSLGKAEYTKVVGVGCWDFGIFYPEDSRHEVWGKYYDETAQKNFKADESRFHDLLEQTITRNPSVLFLLKEHPGVLLGRKASGIDGLDHYDNVIVLKNELPIDQCIAVSDVWLVYESTTALEAWLIGKQTALLNPSGRDFPRDVLHQGSPDYATSDEVCDALQYFFSNDTLPGFMERQGKRDSLIEEVIQWGDGLNHVRVGNEILELLRQKPPGPLKNENTSERLQRWRQHVRWMIKSWSADKSTPYGFSRQEVNKFASEMQVRQTAFYDHLGLKPMELLNIRAI
ncbi:MAG: hypothetical protein WBF69_03050 [Castellaniella sp.]|uniref:BFO_1060 family glycosyltransferase n=1 Tax=Castellaniella sp. TaxID=1955812 RepID=UPI003C71A93C